MPNPVFHRADRQHFFLPLTNVSSAFILAFIMHIQRRQWFAGGHTADLQQLIISDCTILHLLKSYSGLDAVLELCQDPTESL